MTVGLALVVVLACWLPARRAANADPIWRSDASENVFYNERRAGGRRSDALEDVFRTAHRADAECLSNVRSSARSR
jgi:hypothetical protein